LDAVIANDISQEDVGFDAETNAVTIVRRDTDDIIELSLMPKIDAAHRILDEIAQLRQRHRQGTKADTVAGR
jgi:phosphopantothenoylcysteine synthetase/decarboxylase